MNKVEKSSRSESAAVAEEGDAAHSQVPLTEEASAEVTKLTQQAMRSADRSGSKSSGKPRSLDADDATTPSADSGSDEDAVHGDGEVTVEVTTELNVRSVTDDPETAAEGSERSDNDSDTATEADGDSLTVVDQPAPGVETSATDDPETAAEGSERSDNDSDTATETDGGSLTVVDQPAPGVEISVTATPTNEESGPNAGEQDGDADTTVTATVTQTVLVEVPSEEGDDAGSTPAADAPGTDAKQDADGSDATAEGPKADEPTDLVAVTVTKTVEVTVDEDEPDALHLAAVAIDQSIRDAGQAKLSNSQLQEAAASIDASMREVSGRTLSKPSTSTDKTPTTQGEPTQLSTAAAAIDQTFVATSKMTISSDQLRAAAMGIDESMREVASRTLDPNSARSASGTTTPLEPTRLTEAASAIDQQFADVASRTIPTTISAAVKEAAAGIDSMMKEIANRRLPSFASLFRQSSADIEAGASVRMPSSNAEFDKSAGAYFALGNQLVSRAGALQGKSAELAQKSMEAKKNGDPETAEKAAKEAETLKRKSEHLLRQSSKIADRLADAAARHGKTADDGQGQVKDLTRQADEARASGDEEGAQALEQQAAALSKEVDSAESLSSEFAAQADTLRSGEESVRFEGLAWKAIQKHEGTGVNAAPFNNDNQIGKWELFNGGIRDDIENNFLRALGDGNGFLNLQELVDAQKNRLISIDGDGKINFTDVGKSQSNIQSRRELLANGSFEKTPSALGAGQWRVESSLQGWDVAANGVEMRNNVAGQAQDGNVFVELDGHANSSISQSVKTVKGGQYEVSFSLAARAGVDADSNGMEVMWNGQKVWADATSGKGPDGNVWHKYTLQVEGTGGDDKLTFAAAGKSDSLGASLDNVSMVQVK